MASRFLKAIRKLPEPVGSAGKPGLQALKQHSKRIQCPDPRWITGSVDLDGALRASRPNDARWDYGLGYAARGSTEVIHWVEVHPAGTSNAAEVLKKVRWLKTWLGREAVELGHMSRATGDAPVFHWLATGGVDLDRNARSVRMLLEEGVSWPRAVLKL